MDLFFCGCHGGKGGEASLEPGLTTLGIPRLLFLAGEHRGD